MPTPERTPPPTAGKICPCRLRRSSGCWISCAVDDESPLELHCPHLAEIRRHVESLPAIAETRKYGWTVRAYASGRLLLIVDATRAGYFAIPMSTVERLDVQPIGWLVGLRTDASNQGEEERPCS